MYQEFFNFKELPFNMTSDPEFFFPSRHHEEAFSHLVFGINNRKGIVLITGEIGTGKTTLCRTLLNRLDNTVRSAFVLNPYFSESQLLQLIVRDLGMTGHFSNKLALISAFNDFLLQESSAGHNVILIIDEAQNLNVRQLEQIRLLSNLETEKMKLLQIILVGQPELLEKLRLNSLRQLSQRISVRYHILPLSRDELKQYIEHRIHVASREPDGRSIVHFTNEALDAIYNYSKGTPRLVNILCDRALLSAFVQETRVIEKETVQQCACEALTV